MLNDGPTGAVMLTWPPTYPCTISNEWRCPECGRVHIYSFGSCERGDDNYDGFDFHCDCGAYFKKFCRLPVNCILRSWWVPAT